MGKSKKLYKQMVEIANETKDDALYSLKNWKPTKTHDLTKKESRAAYVGFALGLFNAAESILIGKEIHDTMSSSVYDWLCENVQRYRDDHHEYVATLKCDDDDEYVATLKCDNDDLSALVEFLEAITKDPDLIETISRDLGEEE